MEISVKGHQLDVGDALRAHVTSALQDKVGKYFSDAVDAQVIITKDAYLYSSEIIVHPGKQGLSVQANAKANDVYPSFDEAVSKVAKRLQRYKSKLKNAHGTPHADLAEALNGVPQDAGARNVRKVIFAGAESANDDEAQSEDPAVIAEMTTPIMTLTVSEAVMNLELGDYTALLFRNKGSGSYNMIYRRPDGNIGWVDPDSSLS